MQVGSIKLHIEAYKTFRKSPWLQPLSCQSVNKKSRATFAMRRPGVRIPAAPPITPHVSIIYSHYFVRHIVSASDAVVTSKAEMEFLNASTRGMRTPKPQ